MSELSQAQPPETNVAVAANGNDPDSFAALFEESLPSQEFNEGDIIRGRVVQVAKEYVVVDIGFKSEGQIPIDEFFSTDGDVHVKEGDEVEVLLESREKVLPMKRKKADHLACKRRVWKAKGPNRTGVRKRECQQQTILLLRQIHGR